MFIKRLFDTLISIIGLFFLWPVILLLMVLIRLESKGSPLFIQRRIGKHQRPFLLFKLRTMYLDTEDKPTHETAQSALTKIGMLLRRTKLDELPQLVNVLFGQMSIVGPRPCLPTQTDLINEREKRGVHTLLPGITGLAQVQDIDMSDPVKLAKEDQKYLNKRNFLFDLKLIFLTIGVLNSDMIKSQN